MRARDVACHISLELRKSSRSCDAVYSAKPALTSITFFFNDTATTEIYTLSLHDALPICVKVLNLFSRSRRKTNKRKSKHSAMLRNKETRHRMFIGLLNTTRKLA